VPRSVGALVTGIDVVLLLRSYYYHYPLRRCSVSAICVVTVLRYPFFVGRRVVLRFPDTNWFHNCSTTLSFPISVTITFCLCSFYRFPFLLAFLDVFLLIMTVSWGACSFRLFLCACSTYNGFGTLSSLCSLLFYGERRFRDGGTYGPFLLVLRRSLCFCRGN